MSKSEAIKKTNRDGLQLDGIADDEFGEVGFGEVGFDVKADGEAA